MRERERARYSSLRVVSVVDDSPVVDVDGIVLLGTSNERNMVECKIDEVRSLTAFGIVLVIAFRTIHLSVAHLRSIDTQTTITGVFSFVTFAVQFITRITTLW